MGYDKVRWLKPVYPNQSMYVVSEVIETRKSESKPDRGVLRWEMITYDSNDVPLMSLEATMMIQAKPV